MTWTHYLHTFWNISSRYFMLAGVAFIVWYLVWNKKFLYKKIQLRFPKSKDYIREIIYSITTMLIFAAVPLLLIQNPAIRPHTKYYTDIRQYGLFYFYAAFIIMLFMHDAYFYWMHRLMHHKSIFKLVHLVHHQSTNPSPWAAYSFSPLEAVVEAGIVPVLLFTIPIT